MPAAYLFVNAWREILARIFAGTTTQSNVSPEWLVNPATRRRLKLDYLYPDVGVAVRFSGLTAKGQGRRSDWEVLEDEQRDQTRAELCRLNGVQLAIVDLAEEPAKELSALLRVLSRANRTMARSERSGAQKKQAMDDLALAIQEANRIHGGLLRKPDQMIATLAEAWRDREAGLAADLQRASHTNTGESNGVAAEVLAQFGPGQRVVHSHFGDGVITDISQSDGESRITILFDADQERTFLASLLADKLQPAT